MSKLSHKHSDSGTGINMDEIPNTDGNSKKLQTNHIKMKADALTQDDFSNENCCDDCVDSNASFSGFISKNELSPTRYLEQIDHRTGGILQDLKNANYEFLKAKYNLYKTRSEFYSNKENWDKCKEKTGKQSDGVFKEYFQSFDEHRKLMIERENAEFKYNQTLRVFESLLK